MLWQRLVFGSLMIAALAGILVADAWLSRGLEQAARFSQQPAAAPGVGGFGDSSDIDHTYLPQVTYVPLRAGFLLTLLVALLAVAGAYEFGRLCAAGGLRPMRHWAALVALGLVCVPWLQALMRLGVLNTGGREVGAPMLLICVLGVGFLGTGVGVLWRRTTEQALASMGITLLIIVYIGLLASFALGIRFLWLGPAGAAALVYFILTVKFGDIGAFFVGSALGRHKLAPWLSPGKTWEGAAGAVLGSVFLAELGLWLWGCFQPSLGPPPLTAAQAFVFGMLMAVFGHAGDLVESAMKRDAGVKDSGRVIPAFGGLLDLLDSPLFTAPIAWAWLTFCNSLD